ncbi:MAG: long-chain-acyl-CoA synthetase [Oceanococcaceae bacterium]
MSQRDIVTLPQIARGIVRGLPDLMTANRGLLGLALARPERQLSIGKRIEHWARKRPHATALQFENERYSWAEFNAWANRIADVLRAQGVRSGDTVGVLMDNRPATLAVVAGTLKLGAIAGMLNHKQTGDVLLHSIGLVTPKVMCVGDECMASLSGLKAKITRAHKPAWLWLPDGDAASAPRGYTNLDAALPSASPENPPETATVRLKQPCFFIFTSGTTGLPKASIMTHTRWIKAGSGMGLASLRLKPDDVFYCPLPLYHNNALTVSWGSAIAAGCTLALGRKFSASGFWADIRHHKATAFCYIGEVLRYLLNQPPSPNDRNHAVRVICGNGLRPELWDNFKQRFGIETINEFYGASESNIGFINAFNVDRTAGFCPMSFAVVEFDRDADAPIRNPKGFLTKVSKGGTGLLISEITDTAPFDGYTDKEAGEKKLLRHVFKKGDCWFNTGDLVRDQGYKHIAFVDRTGDTFRWKGENVATTEVEGAFADMPGVDHAVVYGVEIPGADGRAGMAAISLAPAATFDPGIARALKERLPAYAVPVLIRIRPEQETTGTFKYRKVELKDTAWKVEGEPVYVLQGDQYVALDDDKRRKLEAGDLRL